MQANEFTDKWISLDEEVPDFGNDPTIPVMVKDNSTGIMFSVKEVKIERHEPGGYTVWIVGEEF